MLCVHRYWRSSVRYIAQNLFLNEPDFAFEAEFSIHVNLIFIAAVTRVFAGTHRAHHAPLHKRGNLTLLAIVNSRIFGNDKVDITSCRGIGACHLGKSSRQFSVNVVRQSRCQGYVVPGDRNRITFCSSSSSRGSSKNR